MPAAKPAELRRRALEIVAMGEPVAQVPKGLGISEGTLRRWMVIGDVDSGRVEGLTSAEKRELIELRRKTRVFGDGKRNLEACFRVFREGEYPPEIAFRFAHEMAAQGFPVAVTCRVVGVSRSGFYDWGGSRSLRPVCPGCEAA